MGGASSALFDSGTTVYGPVTIPVGTPTWPDGSARVATLATGGKLALVYVELAGGAIMSATYPWNSPSQFSTGPRGKQNSGGSYCYWGVSVFTDSAGANQLVGQPSDCVAGSPTAWYSYMSGIVYGRQQGAPGYLCTDDTVYAHQAPHNKPCYTASSNFQVTLTIPKATLNLTADRPGSDTTKVLAGQAFTFTSSISPNTMGGLGTPRYLQQWDFVEDSSGVHRNPGCGTAATCTYWPPHSGVMSLTAWVNSYVQTATYHVVIGPVGLGLSAAPATMSVRMTRAAAARAPGGRQALALVSPGGTPYTFTPVPSPAAATTEVLSWTWLPDSGAQSTPCAAGVSPCTTNVSGTGGSMKVQARVDGIVRNATARVNTQPPTLTVAAAPQAVKTGNTVTFTAFANLPASAWSITSWTWQPDSGAGGIASGCAATENPCQRAITASGTMTVSATVGGQPLTARVHVSALPCVVNDTILDDSRVRRMLSGVMGGSNANASPELRVERLAVRIRRPDASILDTILPVLPGALPCKAWDENQWGTSQLTALGTILFHIHSHPFYPGPTTADTLPDVCRDPRLPKGRPLGSAPRPSQSDIWQPYPFLVVDKKSVYWRPDPTNPNSFSTFVRQKCDLLQYR